MAPLTLVTIPISHYCEKARWALDRAGLAYDERGSLPLLHLLQTRPRGGRSTPLLVTPEGTFTDSTDILAWIDRRHALYPTDPTARAEALALEETFDTKLGPHMRRVGYFHILPIRDVALGFVTQGVSRFQARLAPPLFPVLKQVLVRCLNISPSRTEHSTARLRQAFADVSARLADGRRYLVGDSFGAADLTFAALASPLLFPPEHPLRWPARAALTPAINTLMDELAATPAGQHALRMYREHRRP